MEFLLHYVWQHRLLPPELFTTEGAAVEVVDPGLHNLNAGPDFFNAKIKIDGALWAGNVEIHTASGDWFAHGHDKDEAYNNVVLHVTACANREVATLNGRRPPQLVIAVPKGLEADYNELMAEATYPPCYRIVPRLTPLTVHSWMSRLTVERLEEKTERIEGYLERTGGNWAQTFFVTLARNFGFGINAEAFERWGFGIDPQQAGKHRDDIFQVEALFFGQAGLLDEGVVPPAQRDDYFTKLQREYAFLRSKFGLQPMSAHLWRFMRLRPQNFPHVRLSQLARLYHSGRADFSCLLETRDAAAWRALFDTEATPYWREHYAFGRESAPSRKRLQTGSLNLILINTVAPLLFAYGRRHLDEAAAEAAFSLLEGLPAERNFVTRAWERAGIAAQHAADSQALLFLRQRYCDRKDCLRCRFGMEYLKGGTQPD